MSEKISRREFVKRAGVGTAALAAVAACGRGTVRSSDPAGDEGGMPMRVNPKDGDAVSLLGYGCMRWPMIKDSEGKDIIDQAKVDEMVDYAIAHGVNYFDSSPVYLMGQSEEATGKSLSRYPRSSYYVATKMSNFRDYSREESLRMYRASFERFRTDYIDYYLLHSLSDADAFRTRYVDNGMMDFLLAEREAGRIRNLGFSFHGPKEGFDSLMEVHDRYHFDFVQIQMNYVDWNHSGSRETDASHMYAELVKRNLPVVIMEPLLGGQLASVPRRIADMLKEREPSKSVASWAFRFCGTYPGVFTVLSGMTYMDHLKDNLDTFLHFDPLDEGELDLLESVAGMIRNYPLVPCTACQYCMPCPYGIDIPGVFRHYNSCVNEGTIAESAAQEDFRKLRRKYLTSYDKAIESVRQADHCITCGECVSHCPQHIRIPAELRRIDAYVEKLKQSTL